MDILILTEGRRNIGFGHITRCISLYEGLAQKGIVPEFIVNGDNSILNFLQGKNYQIFNWLKQQDRLFQILKHRHIIIDSYLAPKSLFDKLFEITNANLVMIDDFNRLRYPTGIVINPSIYGNELGYPQTNGITYLLGKDYIILRQRFWNIPEKKINRKVKNILLTFGGTIRSNFIDIIISSLKAKFNFNFYIIDPMKDMLDVEDVFNLMLKADICISGGGQTLYELARVGVPTLAIGFAENQKLNLQGWQRRGFIEYIGWYDEKNLVEKIAKALDKFIDYEERMKRSKIGRRYVDGKGVARVVDTLLKINENDSRRNLIEKSQ